MKKSKKKGWFVSDDAVRTLFAVVPAALYISRGYKDFRILWMTPKIFDYTGYRPDVFIKRPTFWNSRIHPGDRSRVSYIYTKAIFRKGHVSVDYRFKHKDGQYRWFVDHGSLALDEKGNYQIVGYVNDISERKKVEIDFQKLHRHTNHVLESISDGIIAVDTKWNYTYVNKQAAELSVNKPEDLIGKNLLKIHHNFKDTIFYKNYRLAMVKKKLIKFEKYYDFLARWFSVTVYPSQEGITVHFTDITTRKENERKIKESEERYRVMVDHVKDYAIFMLDENGCVATWNEGAQRIKGYKTKEVIGKHFSIFYPEDEKRKGLPDQELQQAKKTGHAESYGMRIKKNGTTFWVNEITTAMYSDNGKLRGFSRVLRDINDQHKAQEILREQTHNLALAKSDAERARAKDEALLNSIGEGIVATDSEGRVVLLNQQAREMFGYERRDIHGVMFYDLWDTLTEHNDVVPPSECPIFLSLKTGTKIINTDYSYATPMRKKFPAATTAAPVIFNNKITGVIAVFRDITREKEIDRAKSEFVSLASHQLRTPLTAIKLFVDMLLTGGLGDISKPQTEALRSVEESNQKMIELVDTLLNVSRIETGKLKVTPEKINLKDFLWRICDNLFPLAESKKVSLKARLPPGQDHEITTDSNLLRQVVGNLITNAIQYSPHTSSRSKQKVPVILTMEKRAKEYVVSVKDKGIGIPKEGQAKIFDRFFRADNAIKIKGDGSGLGLYMCKMIMQALGGKIWVDSKMGQGSTFYITVPYETEQR
jgi:PAS domain S-box-containing protein